MRVLEIEPGLWRWTSLHPAWTAEDEWEEEVGCTYFEAADAVVLFDPLVPPEDSGRFLSALDLDLSRSAQPLAILLTVPWHARSAGELVELYGATVGAPPPEGVSPFWVAGTGGEREALYWLEGPRALVVGDVLIGDPLRLCPDSWLPDDLRGARIRDSLRPLLDLPIERILTAHGEPVLEGGHDALAELLA